MPLDISLDISKKIILCRCSYLSYISLTKSVLTDSMAISCWSTTGDLADFCLLRFQPTSILTISKRLRVTRHAQLNPLQRPAKKQQHFKKPKTAYNQNKTKSKQLSDLRKKGTHEPQKKPNKKSFGPPGPLPPR